MSARLRVHQGCRMIEGCRVMGRHAVMGGCGGDGGMWGDGRMQSQSVLRFPMYTLSWLCLVFVFVKL